MSDSLALRQNGSSGERIGKAASTCALSTGGAPVPPSPSIIL
jgi:hypothetical protein